MNKRTFLQRLASTVAAIALAPALCRGIGRLEVDQDADEPIKLVTNPAYETAPYEMGYIFQGDEVPWYKDHKLDGEPARFNFVNGEYVRVYPTL